MLYVFIGNRSSYDGTYALNDDDYREDGTVSSIDGVRGGGADDRNYEDHGVDNGDDNLGIDPHWRTSSASHGNRQGVRAAGGASGVEMTTVTREKSMRYSSNPIRESK